MALSPDLAQELTKEIISTPEIRKWPIDQKIGQGAFGDAFLVIDPKTRNKYVLKRVRMARQNEWQREATKQEIKLGVMLSHPFIVRFCKSWIRDGHEVNIVYGYCEQGDLQTMIKKRKGKHLDEISLRRWLVQLLLALHYMRTKHVLHRDLKTSNIFLTAENDVQVGDFGLATIRADDDVASHDQSIVGTPHFMSPEVLNRKKYDYKTDVWSLGCVMYECTSFHPAFDAFNLNGLVSKICKSTAPPLPSQYSEQWNSLIKWMLKKDADKRPSVEELLSSAFLREDVAWACMRARQISPEVQLPPFTATSSSLCMVGVPRTPTDGGDDVGFEDDRDGDDLRTPLRGSVHPPPRPADKASDTPPDLISEEQQPASTISSPLFVNSSCVEERRDLTPTLPKPIQLSSSKSGGGLGKAPPFPTPKPDPASAHGTVHQGNASPASAHEKFPATTFPTVSASEHSAAAPASDPSPSPAPASDPSPSPAPAPVGTKRTRRSSFLEPTVSSALAAQAAVHKHLLRTASASRRQPGVMTTRPTRAAMAAPTPAGGRREAFAVKAPIKGDDVRTALASSPTEGRALGAEPISGGGHLRAGSPKDKDIYAPIPQAEKASGPVFTAVTNSSTRPGIPQGGRGKGEVLRPSSATAIRAASSRPHREGGAASRPSTAGTARNPLAQQARRGPAAAASSRPRTASSMAAAAPTYRDACKAIGVARGDVPVADADEAGPPARRLRKAVGTPEDRSKALAGGASAKPGIPHPSVPLTRQLIAVNRLTAEAAESPLSPPGVSGGPVDIGDSKRAVDDATSQRGPSSLIEVPKDDQLFYSNQLFQCSQSQMEFSPSISCDDKTAAGKQSRDSVPVPPSPLPSISISAIDATEPRIGPPSEKMECTAFSGFRSVLRGPESNPAQSKAPGDGIPTPTVLITAGTPQPIMDPMSLATDIGTSAPTPSSCGMTPTSGLSEVKRALDLTGCSLTPTHGDIAGGALALSPVGMEVDQGSLNRWAGQASSSCPKPTTSLVHGHGLLSPTSEPLAPQVQNDITIKAPDQVITQQSQIVHDRMLLMERMIGLSVKLHAAGRWQELGNVLSSLGGINANTSSFKAESGTGAHTGAHGVIRDEKADPPHGSLKVGDKVAIAGSGPNVSRTVTSNSGMATVRYVGPCHWEAGSDNMIGLELDRPEGLHCGIVDGVVYFRCKPRHGEGPPLRCLSARVLSHTEKQFTLI